MDYYEELEAELEVAELGTGDFDLLGEPFRYPEDVSQYGAVVVEKGSWR